MTHPKMWRAQPQGRRKSSTGAFAPTGASSAISNGGLWLLQSELVSRSRRCLRRSQQTGRPIRAGVSPSRAALVRAELAVTVVEGSPQVPASDCAVRSPFGANALDLLGRRTFPHAVDAPDGVLNSEIQLGKDVSASQAKHEKHLRGAASDPFDLDEVIDEIVVVHRLDGIERKRSGRDLR